TTSAPVSITVANNQPPSVALTAPTTGTAYMAPATVTISATASDPEDRLSKVEFYAGTTLLGTATTSPFAFSWSSVPAGTYSLTAIAYDADGATTTSAPVSITVANNQPPSVALTAPTTGTAYMAPATVTISATASDPEDRLSKVEFYAGTTL